MLRAVGEPRRIERAIRRLQGALKPASEPADLISRHGVSHLLCLPSLYAVLLEQSAAFGSLWVVVVAGESCPARPITC